MNFKKIFLVIVRALVRLFGLGLFVIGLTNFPSLLTKGGYTTNIITLGIRLAYYLGYIIVGYGLMRMAKWSLYGIIGLFIIMLLIPFNNLYISTKNNITEADLGFSSAVYFLVIFLVLFTYRKILFSKENKLTSADVIKNNRYDFYSILIGVGFLILDFWYIINPFIKKGIWTTESFTTLPSRDFYTLFYGLLGFGLVLFKKYSIHLLCLNLFLSIVIPVYNFTVNPLYDFNPSTIPNPPNIYFFLTQILINTVVLLTLIKFKKTRESEQRLIDEKKEEQTKLKEIEMINNGPKEEKTKRYGYLNALSTFTVLVVVACIVINISKKYNLSNSRYYTNNQPTSRPTKIELSKEPQYTTYNVERYEIIDTSQNPPVALGLHLLTRYFYLSPNLIRWKNYLIGINVKNFVDRVPGSTMNNEPTESTSLYNKIDSVRIYNLDSKESFDIKLEEPIVKPYYGDVVSKLLENTFYFGASSNEGFGLFEYKLELPPSKNSKIIKLPESIGDNIKKIGNVYISSACYEGCSYALFNSTSSTETVLARMNKADDGYDETRLEKFIGIDSQGRMIIDSVKDNLIAAVPLTNEKLTIPLIEKDKLPIEVFQFSMVDGIDKILMLGENKAYIYNINQNKFEEIQINQETNRWRYYGSNNNKVCLSSESKKTPKTIFLFSAIDMITNKYLEVISNNDCFPGRNTTVDEIFEKLNLPDNYQLKDASLTFETYWRYL